MGTENPRSIRYWNVVQYFKYSLKFSNSVSFSSSNPANQISRNHTLHLSLSLTHWIHFITKFCWLYFLNISQTHPFLFPLYCSYHEKLTSTLPWTKSDHIRCLMKTLQLNAIVLIIKTEIFNKAIKALHVHRPLFPSSHCPGTLAYCTTLPSCILGPLTCCFFSLKCLILDHIHPFHLLSILSKQ